MLNKYDLLLKVHIFLLLCIRFCRNSKYDQVGSLNEFKINICLISISVLFSFCY